MTYVDGFLLPVPRKKLGQYRRIARVAGRVWRELGAIDYKECVGEDVSGKAAAPFGRAVRAKRGEVIVFSWIAYKSKADRNRVNAKVMKDPRILEMMESSKGVFDMKRMAYGGFKAMIDM